MTDPRRSVPRTDTVLAAPSLVGATRRLGLPRVKAAVAAELERCRRGELAPEQVVDAVNAALPLNAGSLRPVVNATGVVVHTNLGRAPLSAAAVEALGVAAGTTDVEMDLATARRGPRGRGALDALAAAVPAAEGVHVVNNGAAAVLLATTALCSPGRCDVVVSRGELVEIGDGFRIPDLLTSVGARLREVGTTNRVHLHDYAEAIDDSVALVLKVHPSNFRVEGFTSSVSVSALAQLTRRHTDVPLVADIGSGLLSPHPRLPQEPDAASTLRDGADLVTGSGDKLLGGPQSGLLLGRADLVLRLRRHPLARAVRVDKLTLAALEATLAGPPTPVSAALDVPVARLRHRAERLATVLGGDVAVVDTDGRIGGGGAPGVPLPSVALSLPVGLATALRTRAHPVVGHVTNGRLLLDLLAVPAEDDGVVLEAVRESRRLHAATQAP